MLTQKDKLEGLEIVNTDLTQLLSTHNGYSSFFGSFYQILVGMGVAYLGGVLASLTPCVYPMIPITVSVVGGIGAGEKRSWSRVAVRGLFYVAGMTVIYSFLGVVAGLTGKVFGTLTNTPGWYICLGLIMSLAALMMLDVIPFDPAVTWQNLKRRFGIQRSANTGALKTEMNWTGAFFLGASSGFLAAPCTTPVLTSILAYIAKTQSIGTGLCLMFSFSLGLGTILLIVAMFAGSLQVLPRSGQWMKTIKTVSGVILLLFAEYLIYRAGQLGGL